MLGTASWSASLQRLRFPVSSGLGFNYLKCNATGEREAGNLPGDMPMAPLCHQQAGRVLRLKGTVGPLTL